MDQVTNPDTATVRQKAQGSPLVWVIGLVETLVMGNMGAFLLMNALMNADVRFYILAPLVFLPVPSGMLFICYKVRLFKGEFQLFGLALWLVSIGTVIWSIIFYQVAKLAIPYFLK